ncbi:hypothetical protein NMQ14_02975 [Methyloversatilis sp. XJ19-13]|nr:hypothetical protein [Methyloversatilis sp. XJ19-13]MCQ9373207.1 hypothetical protein [Methyloversatilis sp. XJ19-13]
MTPIGRPALVKPMNNGIEEQEQKGVTVPSSAARTFPLTPVKRPRMRRVRSGGKWLCTYEMAKMSTASRMNILTVS